MSLTTKGNNAIATLVDFYATALAEEQARSKQLQQMAMQQPRGVAEALAAAGRLVTVWREQPGVGFGPDHEDMTALEAALNRIAAR